MHASINFKAKLLPGLILMLVLYFNNVSGQVTANQLQLPAADYKITFKWLGDTVNSRWEPYAAMLVPVRFPGCPKEFYMQFDMGAPHSLFYRGRINAIRKKYPHSIPTSDSSSKLKNLVFLADKQKIVAQEIGLKDFEDTTVTWDKSVTIIGTIGSDLIAGKTVIINYPGRQLTIAGEIPGKLMTKVSLSSFMFIQGSILLPAVIRGKQSLLYFDTGSSAFELLTSKEVCNTLASADAVATSYPVKSWGKSLTANTVATADSIVFASHKLPIKFATYIEGASDTQIQQMMKMGIGGMTGNKLFLNAILVLDTKNKKFGVLLK